MVRKIRPISRILKIETEINRGGSRTSLLKNEMAGLDQTWIPAVDIYEKDNEVIVEAELPGVLQKDVRILLYGSRIEIAGFKEEYPEATNVRYHRLERECGRFRRLIFIPSAVVPDKACASLENGILTISLKKHPGRNREIEVKIQKHRE